MIEKNEIIKHYEKIMFARDSERMHLSPQVPEIAETIETTHDSLDNKSREIIGTKRPLFGRYDYGWIQFRENFRTVFERSLQIILVDIIAEIDLSRPSFNRLGNICVRISATANMNAESFVDGPYKYICLTSAYISFVKEYLICTNFLANLGRQSSDPPGPSIHFGDTAIQIRRALNERYDECVPAIDKLLNVAVAYAAYDIPDAISDPVITRNTEDLTLHQLEYGRTIFATDLFFVLHELGHLLEHDFSQTLRNHDEEVDADRAASSLFIIACARESWITPAYGSAPALFMAILRHFNLVRRTFKHVSHLKSGTAFDLQGELREEKSLKLRTDFLLTDLLEWGLPKAMTDQYVQAFRAYYLVIAATQILLHQKVVGSRITLDEVFPATD